MAPITLDRSAGDKNFAVLEQPYERTQLVLAGLANNVNQLAKWANTNRVLPDSFESTLGDIGRAMAVVTEAVQRVPGVFGTGR